MIVLTWYFFCCFLYKFWLVQYFKVVLLKKEQCVIKLDLTKHITPHTNGEPFFSSGAPHIHFIPVLQRFYVLSGLPMATLRSKASSKANLLNDDTY